MNGLRLSRRQVIGAAGVSAGALALYGIVVSRLPADRLMAPVLSEFDALLALPRWSASVGEAYLASRDGGMQDAKTLREQLADSLQRTGESGSLAQAEQAIIDDFEKNDICRLDGWTLSLTECRLGALVYLTGSRSAEPAPLEEAEILELVNWGPRTVQAGDPFNEQPNGNSALWLKFAALERGNYLIRFGDHDMITSVHPDRNLVTADLLPNQSIEATSAGGEVPVFLVDRSAGQQQQIGVFVIKGQLSDSHRERKAEQVRILGWGPKRTEIGQGFNLQPEGLSAFWVQTGGSHRRGGNYELMLGDVPMRTTVRKKVITASLPPGPVSRLVAAETSLLLVLIDRDLGTRYEVGQFSVTGAVHAGSR